MTSTPSPTPPTPDTGDRVAHSDTLTMQAPLSAEVIELLAETGATHLATKAATFVPFRRSKAVFVPFVCDIGSTPVSTAIDYATTFITKLELYPGKKKKLLKTYAAIATWCEEHAIQELGDIVDDTAEQLIIAVTGVPSLHPAAVLANKPKSLTTGALNEAAAAAADERRRIHHVHNALVSLRSATVLTRTRQRSHRVTDDSLAYGLPVLPSLEDRKGRPLTDEEILLGRFMVEIDREEGALPRPSLAYLVGESGIRLSESSSLDTECLNSRTEPFTVTAPGVWEFGSRTVKLTTYARVTMPNLLDRLRPHVGPLTYTGSNPGGKNAHTSVSDVILRHLRRAGVADPEVTAMSLNLWRPYRALVRDGDMSKARNFHGGQTSNVLEDLKLKVNDNDLHTGSVHLHRRDNEQFVTTVAPASFYDESITKRGNRRRRNKAHAA